MPYASTPGAAAPLVSQAIDKRPSAILLLVLPLACLIWLNHLTVVTDPDYWWHYKTGEYIVQTGSIPTTDPFSYTAGDRQWVTHEWLTEVLFYLLQTRLGYWANVMLFGLLSVATWLLVYLACRERGVGEPVAAFAMVWAFWAAAPSLNARPQVVTMLFTAFMAYALLRHHNGNPRLLWLVPLTMVAWVNMHGGFIIGIAILGLALLAEFIEARTWRPTPRARQLAAVIALSVLASFLNPNGVRIWLYPFIYAGTGNASMRYVAEWQAPDFHQTAWWPYAAVLLAAAWLGLRRAAGDLVTVLLALVLGAMSLVSERHVALFAIACVPPVAAGLADGRSLARRALREFRHPRMFILLWPAVAVVFVSRLASPSSALLQLGREPSARGYPEGGAAYLAANCPDAMLYNEYGWGGYLIYRLYPEHRVYIDGRADLHGDDFLEQYIVTAHAKPDWRLALDDHRVTHALVPKDGPLAAVLTEAADWQLVYAGDIEAVFARQ